MTNAPLTKTPLNRRALVAGVAATLAVPALAAAPAAPSASPAMPVVDTAIGRLWNEAEALRGRLAAHRAAIAEAASRAGDGVPGWMRLGGEANALADRRYQTLVSILNATPESSEDLSILARVAQDEDMLAGGRAWAAERLAAGVQAYAA